MDMFAAYILWQDRRNLPVSIGFIARITSTSSLQPPWNITLCVLNHYISLSYIIPHETSLFFDDYPHCHTLYNYFHNVPTICVLVKRWLASGLRLPRSEVGRWPLSNWAMQLSHVPPADPRVCDPIAFGVPLPLSSDLRFDFDWPSGGCYWIFRGSVVRSCGYFSSFGEISVSSVAWDWSQVASTWHHRQLPLEDDTWTME